MEVGFDRTFLPPWLLSQNGGIDTLNSRDSTLIFPRHDSVVRSFSSYNHLLGRDGDHVRERFLERAICGGPGQENSFERPPAPLPPGVHFVVEGALRRGEVSAAGPVGVFGRRRPLLSRVLGGGVMIVCTSDHIRGGLETRSRCKRGALTHMRVFFRGSKPTCGLPRNGGIVLSLLKSAGL